MPPALLSGCIEVYTKADLLDEEARRQWRDALEEEPPDGGALLVSAVDGSGLSELTSAISTQLGAQLGRARKTLRLPLDGGAALAHAPSPSLFFRDAVFFRAFSTVARSRAKTARRAPPHAGTPPPASPLRWPGRRGRVPRT